MSLWGVQPNVHRRCLVYVPCIPRAPASVSWWKQRRSVLKDCCRSHMTLWGSSRSPLYFSLGALALALSFAYGGVSVLTAKCCEPVPTKHDRLPPRSLLGLAVLFSSGIAGLLLRLAFLAVPLPLARPRAMQTDGDRDRG